MSFVTRRVKAYQFITSPERWSTNLLALKRSIRDKEPRGPQIVGSWEIGFLRRDELMRGWESGVTIYHFSVYSIRGTTDFSDLPQTRYSSVEELVKDGWIVD